MYLFHFVIGYKYKLRPLFTITYRERKIQIYRNNLNLLYNIYGFHKQTHYLQFTYNSQLNIIRNITSIVYCLPIGSIRS